MVKQRVIILAGGSGTRYGGKKQFVQFRGKALWQHIYDKVVELLPKDTVVIVGIDVPGGSTRNRSVQNGLNYFADGDRVMIFDSARPMVTLEQIKRLMAVEAPSATYAMPCVDTLVKIDGTPVNRSEYMRVQTPQAFDFRMLKDAVENDQYAHATDETRVMYDEYGISPVLIEGSETLMKITYPDDLEVMEQMLTRNK